MANSIANSERSDFGIACTTVDRRPRGSDGPALQHPGAHSPSRPACSTTQLGEASGAVAEHQLLAGTDPAHRGGVKTFVAANDGKRAGIGQCVDVEQLGYSGHHRAGASAR